MEIFLQALQQLGLSEKEILVCKFLMEYGDQPASIIAKGLNMQRSTVYLVLEKLINQSFVKILENGTLRYYSLVSTSIITNRIEQRALELYKQAGSLRNVEELMNTRNEIKNKDKIEIYRGEECVNTILDEIIEDKPENTKVFITQNMHNYMDVKNPDYAKVRSEKNIFAFAIYAVEKQLSFLGSSDVSKRKTRFLSKVFNVDFSLLLFEDRSIIVSPMDNFALSIRGNGLYKGFNKMFDVFWTMGKKM